jgi:hypothetical protein
LAAILLLTLGESQSISIDLTVKLKRIEAKAQTDGQISSCTATQTFRNIAPLHRTVLACPHSVGLNTALGALYPLLRR